MIEVQVIDCRSIDSEEALLVKEFYNKVQTEFPDETGVITAMFDSEGQVSLQVAANENVIQFAGSLFEELNVLLQEKRK